MKKPATMEVFVLHPINVIAHSYGLELYVIYQYVILFVEMAVRNIYTIILFNRILFIKIGVCTSPNTCVCDMTSWNGSYCQNRK